MSIRMPHSFSVIFMLIVLMAVLSWVLPAGKFDRVYNKKLDRDIVVAGSYKVYKSSHQGYMSVFSSFSKGFVEAAEVISFVLIVGGAYGIILKTGAIDNAFRTVIHKLGDKALLLIPLMMILFSIAGSVQGFWEETLPFYLIIIPLMIRMGYDSVVGLAVIVVGAGTGNLASTLNPFSTGIASSIAETTVMDGIIPRLIIWVVSVSVSIAYVLWYAARVKKDHSKSVVAKDFAEHKKYFSNMSHSKEHVFTKVQKIITCAFLCMIGFMMYAISQLGWWIPEITTLFLTLALFSAILSKMKESDIWDNFVEGAQSFIYAALVIALARAIVVVAQDGMIMDTILYEITNILSGVPKSIFVFLSQFFQTIISMVVPSSSGDASLTMPIMAPLADLLEVPRSTVITSFQSGSGIANLITPTAGVLMAALGMAKVSWGNWVKFIVPLLVIQFILTTIINTLAM